MKRMRLDIDGMTCGHCVATLHSALAGLDGVAACDVHLDRNIANVEYRDSIGMAEISGAVADAGFRVSGFTIIESGGDAGAGAF